MKSLNINETVRLKLTILGKNIIDESVYRGYVWLKYDENDILETELWTAMSLFGKHLGNGFPLPFETDIYFRDKDLKEVEV